MGKYNLHSNLRISSISNLLKLREDILADREDSILLDFEKVFYLTPFSMCFFQCLVDELRGRDTEVDFFMPKFPSAKRQLRRMSSKIEETINGRAPTIKVSNFPFEMAFGARSKLKNSILKLIKTQISFTNEVGHLHHFALKEIIENAAVHSRSQMGCYVCANGVPQKRLVRVCFLDKGIGIHESLKIKYPDISNSEKAILESLKLKVSGTQDPERGLGLHILKLSIVKNEGNIVIISGNGKYELISTKNGLRERSLTMNSSFPGTIVDVVIKSNPEYRFYDDNIEEIF